MAKKNEDAKTPEAEAEVKVSKSVVPAKYRKRYGKSGTVGDQISKLLASSVKDDKGKVDAKKLAEVGKANKLDVAKRWGHLNIGMRRMNLGNVLRARVVAGDHVVIGAETFNAEKAAA